MSMTLQGQYHGKSGPLFKLYIKTALLTVLTLGIYRFWGKTRIRKYIWSATSGGDDSFEYTGTGLEKFLGFLIAIIVLAIYLGVVQMVLFFFGIVIFTEPTTQNEALLQMAGVYISFLAVLPLIFFAQYRARRYRMARTRWRGLRFGMEKGAWGYALRAMGHGLLTVLTLGLLLPRQTYFLEKYMADRTWYGDAKFEQRGRWQSLFAKLKHVFIGVAILIVGIGLAVAVKSGGLAAISSFVGYIWILIGFLYYRVHAFNYLTQTKQLDGKIEFSAEAQTSSIFSIYFVGVLAMIAVSIVLFTVVFFMVDGIVSAQGGRVSVNFGTGQGIASLIVYIAFFLLMGGISLVLITQKVIAHYVQSVDVYNAEQLDSIRQRVADTGADAEGFADALDVGAAI